jgi:hypothetical protein
LVSQELGELSIVQVLLLLQRCLEISVLLETCSKVCNKVGLANSLATCCAPSFALTAAVWYIGGADVTVKTIPTTIQIILLKKIRFYSESNLF